ncbi:MAG: hypothetical protein QOD10_5999 [Mycobacterium sp.]|jgi:hypothetical protein|nr:hypothetical protein [Mycobacterium sp.]
MKHTCSDNWVGVHRMVLALIQWDEPAYRYAMAELGRCPDCLGNALAIVLHMHSNNYALHAGGLDKAADYLTDELERLLMPSEKTDDRMTQLDRQNRINRTTTSENHNPKTE